MVSTETNKSKAIGYLFLWVCFLLVFGLLVAMCVVAGMQKTKKLDDGVGGATIDIPFEDEVNECEDEEQEEYERIDLQNTVNTWAAGIAGNKSVLIYDVERGEIIADYNSDEKYNTASLYKLFVVYEGYRLVASGEWETEGEVGKTGKTVLECLDLSIRESNSNCAESLWNMIGRDKLDNIIQQDFKITDSKISSLLSNAKDILKMMKIFYEHPDIDDENLIALMEDSFLNQPVTTYDWRRGLPSGFSDAVKVYNKVGWEYNRDKKRWNIYHDAAIVELENGRHLIVVVMTNYIDFKDIAKLGTMIETTINTY